MPPHDAVGIDPADPPAIEHDLSPRDLAVLGLEQTGNGFQRGGLAGPAGAEQRHHRAVRHLEAQAPQDENDLVVRDFDVAHGE